MWSASALRRNCAFPAVIGKRPPDPKKLAWVEAALKEWPGYGEGPIVSDKAVQTLINQHVSKVRGTAFHLAVETYLRTGEPAQSNDLELDGWVDALLAQWSPPAWVKLEIAWGLGFDGQHLMVAEPRPHQYESMGGLPLLTAGRCDIVDRHPITGYLWVSDWKTGKSAVEPPATNLQVNAAGLALVERFGAPGYVPRIYHARDAVFEDGDPVERGSDAAREMFEDVKRAALLPDTAIPGAWCASCWDYRLSRCEDGLRYAPKR